MTGWSRTAIEHIAARLKQWRRARNVRSGLRSRTLAPALRWSTAAGLLATVAGGAVIAVHAVHLGATDAHARDVVPAGAAASVDVLHSTVPGAAFDVPERAGVTHTALASGGSIVVAQGMRSADPVRIDLCDQLAGNSRQLVPLRIGYRFDDVARLVGAKSSSATPLRHVALEAATEAPMPKITVTGGVDASFPPLQLAWTAGRSGVTLATDAGPAAFRRDAWIIWPEGALRLHRRAGGRCAAAGQLVLQLYRKGTEEAARALVTGFPREGRAVSAWLRPGHYTVPHAPRASLEDQALFEDLYARDLVRLRASGLVEVAPADLAAWQAAPGQSRDGELAAWGRLDSDAATMKLFKRLYRMADGAYVREQIRLFNQERRLLAWRVRPLYGAAGWRASASSAPLATAGELPPAAARLFAEVPQGWAPWRRVAAWPEASASSVQLAMQLPQPARGGERIEMLLVGSASAVGGARIVGQRSACTGRACRSADAVQLLTLEPLPGTRTVFLHADALDMGTLGAGDQQYRHLRLAGGKLAWKALATNSSNAGRAEPAGVTLTDRRGTLLWSGGAPTPEAVRAGLAPLLGLRPEHANSVAGMLARVPSPGGEVHHARLTLDLALQQLSHAALDCIGMRRGRWDGVRCSGGQPQPHGRQAGIVILDADNGDVLASAGAGTGKVDAANWNEVRDFDRANPDRSPLRLPALQHNGGAHRSPGSTFKIISALGLELAAQRDPQLEALLDGLPLPAINRMAQRRGFAFQTNAASYPFGTRLAHITNYRDQHLDKRAQDGRLGLSQALTYSLNTWFAWSGELSDRSLFGRADGGVPDLQALEPGALDGIRPIAAMAHLVGFGQQVRLDGGLLPPDFRWSQWDALQPSEARIDPVHTRHELRQMAIGLRMQATPLHMAMVAGAVGQGRAMAPRLLLELDGQEATTRRGAKLDVRLDRVRAGLKGVVDAGTAAAAFRGKDLDGVRRGLSGKTGTSPAMVDGRELATVWFTGWLEPGSVPGQKHRLAVAAFVSHSEATGGEHAAPIVAAVLAAMPGLHREQRGK